VNPQLESQPEHELQDTPQAVPQLSLLSFGKTVIVTGFDI
jgi:hypothetical protein